MIPRYQRILFWCFVGAILLMALVLLRGCEQAREKLTRHRDETPLAAPTGTPSETIHLAMADDATGSIAMMTREMSLPSEPTGRVRVLLGRLIAEYSYKNSAHALESGPAVDDVFLLDLPLQPAVTRGGAAQSVAGQGDGGSTGGEAGSQLGMENAVPHSPGGQMTVVSLRAAFADHHPSGIEAEMLTIDSIVGTLYANFPRIEQVRFLVDGQPRATLNGHADLIRAYPVVDTATRPVPAAGRQ